MASLELEKIEVYQRAMAIGVKVHQHVIKWSYFYRITIGRQLIESTDSIAANNAEGYGRFFYKENRNFCYYARGSLSETKTWIHKANQRKIISDMEFAALIKELEILHFKLNIYINSIGSR